MHMPVLLGSLFSGTCSACGPRSDLKLVAPQATLAPNLIVQPSSFHQMNRRMKAAKVLTYTINAPPERGKKIICERKDKE